MRSEILMAANAKITFFWDMTDMKYDRKLPTTWEEPAPFLCEDGDSTQVQNTDNIQSHCIDLTSHNPVAFNY
jgi:hypothetical protein